MEAAMNRSRENLFKLAVPFLLVTAVDVTVNLATPG